MRPVKAVRPAGIGRLMAAEPQRLALGLAHHVQQAAQRLDREFADGPLRGVHLDRKGRDLDRRGLAGAQQRRDRGRLLEQHGIGLVEQPGRARCGRPRLARSSTSERFDVLRNWNSALSPCGRSGGARRTGSPPGGSILSTSAPRSAAILRGQRRRKPQAERHVRVVHLDDREARQRQGGSSGDAHASRGFGMSRVLRLGVYGGFHGTDRQSQGPARSASSSRRSIASARTRRSAWRATWS